MFRFKTLFGRMLFTYMLIAVFTILLLAVMMTQILRMNDVSNATVDMYGYTEEIDKLVEDTYHSGLSDGELLSSLSTRANTYKIAVWIYDRFNIPTYSTSGDMQLMDYQEALLGQEEELFNITQQGKRARSVHYDDSIYATPVVTVAVPLTIGDNVTGCIILHKRLSDFEESMRLIYVQLLVCGGISALLAFAMIFFTSRKIERPLADINSAVNEMAKGNFSRRLEIKEHNEVGQLGDTFNYLAQELEKYESTRTSFVANVSHELRSPLTSIQGLVQGMLDGTIPEHDHRQYLEIVLHEAKRLGTLTRDLLELAKAESGQFPLNRTVYDINEQIRRCFIGFLGKIEEKNLEITIDLPEDKKTMVDADEDRIAQVLTNLMDNAVKFCEEEGQFKIWTYESGAKVFVNILNTGAVIPAEDLPFVFDRFYKVDKSHNRQSPGSGIGLSLVRNIINQHGEEVNVASDPSSGTVFTFTLPLAQDKPEKQ